MGDDWSGLGFNPTPGHPHLATNLAEHLKGTAGVLKETHALLDSLSKESSHWKGKAHSAFTEKISDLPKYLKDAKESLQGAGKEIQAWSDSLHGMKVKAGNYEEDAKAARKAVSAAEGKFETARKNPDLRLAGQFFQSNSELESAQSRIDTADNAVEAARKKLEGAQDKLQELIDSAEELERNHGDTAQDHADRVRKYAEDHAPGDWLDGLSDWWDKHGGDLLTVAATVVGIAAIFLPVLAPIAIGLSLAAAAQHTYQYSKSGKDMWPPTSENLGEWATVGGDVLGAVPGVGPAYKGARAAIGAGRASKAVSGGAKVVQASKAGASEFKVAARAVNPSNRVIAAPAEKAAKMLGGSGPAVQMTGDVTQATVTGGLATPTAMSLWDSSDSTAELAKKGTVAADGIGVADQSLGPLQKAQNFAKAL